MGNANKAGFSWLLKMAWRDGKASYGKLLLFVFSITLGVSAVVSVHSFSGLLKENIASQSKALLGADYVIESDKPVNEKVMGIMDSLGGFDAREINFTSMAAFPDKGGTKLVEVRGVEGGFPFYGDLETEPTTAATGFRNGSALVDATTMLQLNLKQGDSIKLGAVTLPIIGTLENVPGSSSVFGAIAPPVLIPFEFIEATGLVQTGSRVGYKYYFEADEGQDMALLNESLWRVMDENDADLDTHLSEARRLGRRYENFGKFLNLVGFIALLLGCVGIASGMGIYVQMKIKSIAVLKCLGASKRQSYLIFFIQIAYMGIVGGLLGAAIGYLLQQLFPVLLGDLLPVDVDVTMSFQSILLGLTLGLAMSVLFALYPLMKTLYVSPLQTLRVVQEPESRSKWATTAVGLGIVLFVFSFSLWLLDDVMRALFFVIGLLVVFLILTGIAKLFMTALQKFFPHSWGFIARQSLKNLFRPQNQTLVLVLAIGIGTFLISTLYFTKDMLLEKAAIEDRANSANMILMDIQSQQVESIAQTIQAAEMPVIDKIPIVTMRVDALNGRPVDEIRKDTTSQVGRWILNHEFRVTYRDSLIGSERLLFGNWVSKVDSDKDVPISVSSDFSKMAKVSVGDPVSFNVQGKIMSTVVQSVREVDWSRLQPNFSVVFPAGVLEKAPQFGVMTTRTNDDLGSAKLQQQLVSKFPNVSILDLKRILSLLEDILGKISWVINFMAFFSIFVGVAVLMGAIYSSKHQRVKQGALLRTLGAQGSQILKMIAIEYSVLGFLGAFMGVVLAVLGSSLLAYMLFETTFVPSWIPFAIILPAITFLVFALGVGNSISIVKNSPLSVLKKEKE
ncbi:ABC transporter permease [Flagellimonas zhangzhouensis]|uniref:Putative ABC transport system permease protein n=1 Tax=Flagellimonas zhangzhouensis TaxID=1073328 RepID=A0A1H2YCJ0_9FLAO|nr:FtsX-like permease family protein [Allomuricauda zhangzhouensis]SDQ97213.1 putative ABC transport system permease protein [Allomuricauda zhangzhouensis]SDX02770.1 putative ABC transport system permease protein [Allomuricauda zhangzhouensis]